VFGRGSYFGVNGAEIDVPAALADVVGVADSVAELRPLAADITYSCHNSLVPSRLMPRVLLIRFRNLILQEWGGLRQLDCLRAAIPQREAAKNRRPSVLLDLRIDEMAEEIRMTL
jgi:hypothetical protein